MGNGATFKELPKAAVERIRFPMPSIEEQRRIAAILDKADELRAKRRAALEQIEALPQATFLEMFGDPGDNPNRWPVVPIRSFVRSASYGTGDRAGVVGQFPVLRMSNLTYSGRIDLTNLKFMDLAADKVERYTVRNGDLLFNRTNSPELVGKTAVYRGASPMAFAGYLVRVRLDETAESDYLAAILNSSWGKAVLRSKCKSIIGMANINANELQDILVMRPPADLQRRFADLVLEIEERRASYLAALDSADELFASLQHRAFSEQL